MARRSDAFDPALASAVEMLVGFEMGLYSRADVGAWVNAELERHDVLPAPLLELTVMRPLHDVDVASLLRALVPETSTETAARLQMAVLHELVRTGRIPLVRAVRWGWRIAEDISWDTYCQALGLEDAYDLAHDGVYGTVEAAERAFLAFLDRYRRGVEAPEVDHGR